MAHHRVLMIAVAVALLLLLCALSSPVTALDNGMALKPPMGWNTWCTNDICGLLDYCTEKEVRSVADAMVSTGMNKLGYEFINLDDCWAGPRNPNTGELTADPKRFPSGSLRPLAEYVHSKGLKFGVYTCAGNLTCKFKRPGSWGHFEQDARTFADWTVDFVKMDWCYHPNLPPKVVYGMMRDALNKTGRPMLFSICEWGKDNPWEWGMETGNIWRVGPDHLPMWWTEQGTLGIIAKMVGLSKFAGVGGWNDPDFLMPDFMAMSFEDSKTEFSFWSLWSAPLITAVDIRKMSEKRRTILMNEEVIAVDQDRLRIQGDRVANDSAAGSEIWTKPLSDGSYAVILFNKNDLKTIDISVDWSLVFPAQQQHVISCSVRDLWLHKDLGNFTTRFTASKVPPHGVTMIKVKGVGFSKK